MSPSAVYIYCVVRSARRPASTGVPAGVPDAAAPEVRPLAPPLWLVTSLVPLDRYGPGALELRLRDLDWVTRTAVAHEAVVEHFAGMRGVTVIPMKVFTMFSTAESASSGLLERRAELETVFEHIAGCEEWGVRVIRARAAARPRPGPKPRSGVAFLEARKRARDEIRSSSRAATAAAEDAYASLAAIARDQRRRPIDGAGAVAPLLDAAFLVPARRRTRFRAAARKLNADLARTGAELTLTGPWPAYNFVTTGGTS